MVGLIPVMNSGNTRQKLQGVCHSVCVLALVILVGALSGCSKRYDDVPASITFPFGDSENHGVGRFKTSYLAEQIDGYYRGVNPGPIGVTTLVNLDDLYSSSTFGRVYSEQLMSELAMRGYDVVELRQGEALQFMGDGGEFALSRDTNAVRRSRDLGGVVVGTYTVSPIRVYVNARLVDPATSVVLSAGSVEMAKTKEIAKLLRVGSFPTSLERIPVRHLALGAVPMNQGRMYDWEETQGPYAPRANAQPDAPAPRIGGRPVESAK